MKPVKFDGMNCTYTADGCEDLPTRQELDGEHLAVTSVWKPSEEDLKVLNAGGCICLTILYGQPPVSLWAQEVAIME